MTPGKKRSKKRSESRPTTDARLKQVVFYVDECMHSRVLIARMTLEGARVEFPGSAFPRGTPDEEWLAACGDRSWIVLTRDRNIRRRVLEREALVAHGVGAFAFTGGNATGAETANAVARLLSKMVNVSVSEPRPFLYTFGLTTPLVRFPLRR